MVIKMDIFRDRINPLQTRCREIPANTEQLRRVFLSMLDKTIFHNIFLCPLGF
jgi:hypothetical protein